MAAAFSASAQMSSQATADSISALSEEVAALRQDYANLKAESDQIAKEVKNDKLWKRNSFARIGYAATTSKFTPNGINETFKQGNRGGVSLQMGHTYLFPKQPIANLLKIGIDAIWCDFTYGTLKNNGYSYGSIDWDFDPDDYDIDGEDWDIDMEDYLKMKPTFLTVGVGFGPNITVTPLYMLNNAGRDLKISLYGHYRPSLGAYMVSEDGDLEAAWAYTGMWAFGGSINWRMIGIGVEGNWGSGKFKSLVDSFDDETVLETSDRSGKRSFSACRVYISFNF